MAIFNSKQLKGKDMKITKEDVIKTANLAKLDPDETLMEELAYQLENIIEYMDTLKEVNTDDVEPTFHVISKKNAFRDDELKAHAEKKDILFNAPRCDKHNFIVPKVI